MPRGSAELVELFGEIDVYLFDQLLRGRITPDMRVLDAGCGGGRNLIYLLRAGCDVYGVDRDGERVCEVRALAGRLAPDLPSENFRAESVESMTFSDGFFDAVMANALLHFAHDEDHLISMLEEAWRVLAPGGLFFARLATTIGIEDRVQPLSRGGGSLCRTGASDSWWTRPSYWRRLSAWVARCSIRSRRRTSRTCAA